MSKPDSGLSVLWQNAISAYEQETKHDAKTTVLKDDIRTPEELLQVLEAKGTRFHDFRSRHQRVWSRLYSFVAPVSRLATALQAPASSTLPYGYAASAILGGVLYLVTACNDVSNAYDWIENVFQELQDFSDRLTQYSKGDFDEVMQRRITAILVFFLRIIGRSEVLIRQKRFKKYLSSVFLGADSKTKSLLEDLDRETKGELEYAISSIYASSKSALDAMERLEQEQEQGNAQILDSLQETRDLISKSREDDKMKLALYHKDPADSVQNMLSTFTEQLVQGSGDWLDDDPLYRAWLNNKSPILWIFGGAGAGKSCLMARTLRNLQQHYREQDQYSDFAAIAYFFVKEGRASQQDPKLLLETWAWQLVHADELYAKHAEKYASSSTELSSIKQIWRRLFLEFYSADTAGHHRAILLLDGLDEAPAQARYELLALIHDLATASASSTLPKPRIQIAVFSRLDIRSDMSFLMDEKYIEITTAKNSDDISRYIKSRLEKFDVIQTMKKTGPDGHKEASKFARVVLRKIRQGADGIFLWAHLMLQEAQRKDQNQIMRLLDNAPKGLDDMIAGIFDRISKDDDVEQSEVGKIIQWTAFAFRDLRFMELLAVLGLPPLETDDISTAQLKFVSKPLLWRNVKGKLGSVIRIKYQKWAPSKKPDEKRHGHEEKGGESEYSRTKDSNKPLNFSESDDDDTSKDDDDTEDEAKTLAKTKKSFSLLDTHRLQNSSSKTPSLWEHNAAFLSSHEPRQRLACVSFTHSHIREFLIDCNIARGSSSGSALAYLDIDRAHIEMTIDCIKLLRIGSPFITIGGMTRRYSAPYLLLHLEAISRKHVTEADRRKIVNGLAWLFGTDVGSKTFLMGIGRNMSSWSATTGLLFHSNRYTKLVQTWLQEGLDRGYLDNANKTWAQDAAVSVNTLLNKLGRAASYYWLQPPQPNSQDFHNPELAIYVLHNVASLDEQGEQPAKRIPDWDLATLSYNRALDEETIMHLANWASSEKNSLWFFNTGRALLQSGHYQSAAEFFQKAAALDPSSHVASEWLVGCRQLQGDNNAAAVAINSVMQKLEKDNPRISDFLLKLAKIQLQLGDVEAAIKSSEDAFCKSMTEKVRTPYYRMAECVSVFDSARRTDKVMEKLQLMNESATEKGECLFEIFLYQTTQFPLDYIDCIGRAYRQQGCPPFILDAVDRAWEKIIEFDPPSRFRGSLSFATFKYVYSGEPSTEVWRRLEKLLDAFEAFSPEYQGFLTSPFGQVKSFLCSLHFDRIVYGSTPQKRDHHVSKLRNLAMSTIKEGDNFGAKQHLDLALVYPTLLYGRWMRLYGQVKESTWRKWFQSRILLHLSFLEDDDPSNDYMALKVLIATFFHTGDREYAAVLLAILLDHVEDLVAAAPSPVTTLKNEASPQGDFTTDSGSRSIATGNAVTTTSATLTRNNRSTSISTGLVSNALPIGKRVFMVARKHANYRCDHCSVSIRKAKELWFCELCLDTQFCQDCYPKLMNETLEKRICSPRHELYRAWPIPDEAKKVAMHSAEGETMLDRQWLEKVRAEWTEW